MDVEARKMFSGFGLYSNNKFFGIIADGSIYFKTNESTRAKYIAAGSGPFTPSPKQKLKNYYAVPVDILENGQELVKWACEALSLE